MCTAIKDRHLFGRTLDLECSFGEKVIITPRNFAYPFTYEQKCTDGYGIIGTAHLSREIPLYYDAMNEKGLCAAALRFPKSAVYHPKSSHCNNLASYEIIPWLLRKFSTAAEAMSALEKVNVTSDSFSDSLPSTPLHWIVADRQQAFAVESVADGLKIYDDLYGVLTNAPDFPSQCEHIAEIGSDIPGDFSSASRFARAYKIKQLTCSANSNDEALSRFFHIMGTVNQPTGTSKASDGRPMRTVYTSCMDSDSLVYYFTTYFCRRIQAVALTEQYAVGKFLTCFNMATKEDIRHLN